jgi:hypothetical protein
MSEQKSKVPSETQLNREYGKGFNMLKKMGFKAGTGLGPTGEGIVAPIEISMRRPGEGLRDNENISAPTRRKRPKSGKPKEQESSADEDDEAFSDYDSSDSADSGITKPKEDGRITESRKAIENLIERKRELDYKLFTIKQSEFSSGGDMSLDSLVYDLFESDILSEGLSDMSLLGKALDLLRDKYEGDRLWYELDVESLLSSCVLEAVSLRTEIEEISPEIITTCRDMILDDDHFSRFLEFQLLPPFALRPNLEIYRSIKSSASTLHYQSIFSRFLKEFFATSVTKHNLTELITQGWIELVPCGPTLQEFLVYEVKPRLVTGSSPEEVLLWKSYFSEQDLSEIVHHISLQIRSSLSKADVFSSHCFDLVDAAISWSVVVSPCVIGFLLVESGFIGKWFEHNKIKPDFKVICKKWLPLMGSVSYHSPARKHVTDILKFALGDTGMGAAVRRRPGGPPPEFFTSGSNLQETAKVSLGDVIRDRCQRLNISLVPRPGVRENGCQVFKVGRKIVYWKDDSLFEKVGEASWVEIGIDSLLR